MKNKELRQKGNLILSERYWFSVAMIVLYGIIYNASANAAIIGLIFIGYPMVYGIYKYFLNLSKGYADFDDIFAGFSENYIDNAVTLFIKDVFIFLWSLLLFVPGIIKAISYAMTPFVLADKDYFFFNSQAINKSTQLMDGFKWQYFKMQMFYLLLHILGLLTFGLFNLLYVSPRQYAANTQFYYMVKSRDMVPSEIKEIVDEILPEIKDNKNDWDF